MYRHLCGIKNSGRNSIQISIDHLPPRSRRLVPAFDCMVLGHTHPHDRHYARSRWQHSLQNNVILRTWQWSQSLDQTLHGQLTDQ